LIIFFFFIIQNDKILNNEIFNDFYLFGNQTFFVVQKNLFLLKKFVAINDINVFVVAVVQIRNALVHAYVWRAKIFIGVVCAGDEFNVIVDVIVVLMIVIVVMIEAAFDVVFIVDFFVVVIFAVSSFVVNVIDVFEFEFVVIFFAVSVRVAFIINIIIIFIDTILRSAQFVLGEDMNQAQAV